MPSLLRRFAPAYRRYFVIGPLSKLVEVVFDLLTPLVVARMVDEGVAARDAGLVVRYGMVLGVMAVAGFASVIVCQKMAALASQGMGTDIRRALYRRINEFSNMELDRFGTPSLITRITNDVNQVQLAIALGIRQVVRWPLLAIGSMVAALLIDARLGIIFLVSTPLIGVVFWLVMARCVPFFKQMQAKLDHIGLIVREGLSGARVVRAFAREDHERERFAAAAAEQARIATAVGRLSSLLNPVTFLVMNLAVCAILWAGGLRVEAGDLTQGDVVAFVNYMTQTLLSIVYVANLVVVLTKSTASADRINEVLLCEARLVEGLAGESASEPAARADAPALIFDDVSFSYEGAAAPALEHVTLEVAAGETLGVIGGTGSGKSTLVQLVLRLYDVTAGSIAVLGRDARAWSLAELRHEVSLVPQVATLVSGTIRTNLSWRDEHASDGELWRVLEVAQAADFVRALPAGLDSPVEAGGRNFSGGQRQRLTIARALVGEPSILVLDDSSSALDAKTDARLRARLRADAAANPSMPRTTVIVSQRIAAVRDADTICVLSHGRVAGLGSHGELVASCPLYREICASQGVEAPSSPSSAQPGEAVSRA